MRGLSISVEFTWGRSVLSSVSPTYLHIARKICISAMAVLQQLLLAPLQLILPSLSCHLHLRIGARLALPRVRYLVLSSLALSPSLFASQSSHRGSSSQIISSFADIHNMNVGASARIKSLFGINCYRLL